MLTAYVVGDTEVIARLRAMGPSLRDELRREGARLRLALQRRVMQKLRGEVLRVRSDSLRTSIAAGSAHSLTGEVVTDTGVTEIVGTNLYYAKLHEFGVGHSWLIEAKARAALKFQLGGQTLFRRAVTHPPLPERSFLRSALREMTPEIKAGLEAAIRCAVATR